MMTSNRRTAKHAIQCINKPDYLLWFVVSEEHKANGVRHVYLARPIHRGRLLPIARNSTTTCSGHRSVGDPPPQAARMVKLRFTEEQMVSILRGTDGDAIPVVAARHAVSEASSISAPPVAFWKSIIGSRSFDIVFNYNLLGVEVEPSSPPSECARSDYLVITDRHCKKILDCSAK